MAAAFNLQKFPGFKGTDYHVQLADASGLHKGNMVQVAGIRVGRVSGIHIGGDHVTVDVNVKDATLGDKTQASVQVLNLLGEKYLELTPKGSGKMDGGDTIPVSRTNGSYDIVATLERADHHHRGHQHPSAVPGPDHPGRHGQRRQPAHQVDLHRSLPHLPGHRDAATSRSSSCSAGPTASPTCSRSARATSSR